MFRNTSFTKQENGGPVDERRVDSTAQLKGEDQIRYNLKEETAGDTKEQRGICRQFIDNL